MSSVIHFKRTLDSLDLEKTKQQAERSWTSSQTMPTEVVDALVTKVKRLRGSLEAILDEATSDHDRDIIITECWSALREVDNDDEITP